MPKYKYTAKTSTGEIVKGTALADDPSILYSQVKENFQYLIDYSIVVEKQSAMSSISGGKLKLKEVAIFCRQMSAMLFAGVSLVKSIDIMYRQTSSKRMKLALQNLYENVQKGNLLSESLRKQNDAFPEIMINLIESGESSGTLDTVMGKLANQFENELKLKNKVRAALTYPAILAVLGVGVVAILVTFVLPQFISMFETSGVTELPLPTRILLAISGAVTGYWYVIAVVLLALVIGGRFYIRTDAGKLNWDSALMKIPVVKQVVVKTITVRFCRTFAMLFSSGMPMLQSLSIVGRVINNKAIESSMMAMSDDIRRGITLSQAIQKVTVFPPMVQSMVSIGEESGSLDEMMENSAKYFDDELENDLARLVALVEPIMIVLMAVVVGFVIISIMLPMLQIYQNIA